ncbi:hypothetical protein GmHk_18G051899 [Glycine max]|nr:hypothetical protein GmHk_18G051899 [Glycine max]
MLQSLHQGQPLIMQSLQDVVHQGPVMSVEEFLQKVAWLGVQPSPLGGGQASAAQEPQPAQKDVSTNILEPSPSEPFIVEAGPATPQEDTVAVTPQDLPSAPALDLNDTGQDD